MQNSHNEPLLESQSQDENFSFYINSDTSFSADPIKSPKMSEISSKTDEKSAFLTGTPYITIFEENSARKSSDKSHFISQLIENCEIKPYLSESFSELNQGFIDESVEEDDKFMVFKKNFEGLLTKCEYYENENIKNKIDGYLKNINKKTMFQSKENCFPFEKKEEFLLKSNKKYQSDLMKNGNFYLCFYNKKVFLEENEVKKVSLGKRSYEGSFSFKTVLENES